MNFWLFYPVEKLVSFMKATNYDLKSHVLRIGPFAVMIVWRVKRAVAHEDREK
jgi:hypothetical protein